MDPLTTTIAQLAFNEFIKSGAGELAKKALGGTLDLANQLRIKIEAKFKGNSKAEADLAELKNQGSMVSLEKVIENLEVEMGKDKVFATELQQLSQQINNYQNRNTETFKQQNNNYGRDLNVNNVNQPQGNIKIGGS